MQIFLRFDLFLACFNYFQENQQREKLKIEKQKEDLKSEKLKNKMLVKEGKAPVFLSKSDRKKKELVEQFEELKKSGKIDNYLKKKDKKNAAKEAKDRRKSKAQSQMWLWNCRNLVHLCSRNLSMVNFKNGIFIQMTNVGLITLSWQSVIMLLRFLL